MNIGRPLKRRLAHQILMLTPNQIPLRKMMNTFVKNLFLTLLLSHNAVTFADEKELQAQFSQGLKFIKEKNYEQAAPIFSKLIKEHPRLPEAYNNLAFIYATQGHLMKAQETLQAAFKNNPSYALVYENLNSIYAKLSRNIYEKAIGAEDTSREPLKNLYLIDHIFNNTESQTISPIIPETSKPNENLTPITAPSVYAPESK